MSFAPDQRKRRLLPRWRPFDETGATELKSLRAKSAEASTTDDYLDAKIAEWNKQAEIGLAVDILSSAVVLGRTKELERIGWWILTRKESLAPAVLDLASVCVNGPPRRPPHSARTRETIVALLRRCRGMIGENPKDSILYVDMALAHAKLGNLEQAERAIKIATKLAPENRFVLRSAARCWIHLKRPDIARSLLSRSPRTPHDPWLLAAEIAVSQVAEKAPRFVRQSKVFLHNQNSAPFHLSELAGAVGTLEALNGSRKRASELFKQSLMSPTENAVAQAVWASTEKVLPDFELDRFSHLRPDEAETLQARAEMDWERSLAACYAWAEDETYSSNPAGVGSFISAVVGRPTDAKQFSELGLESNPNDFGLRNNLFVADIMLGNLNEAFQTIAMVKSLAKDDHSTAVFLATSGLALFHLGQIEEAREMYRKAISLASETKDRETAAFAAAFWARTEIEEHGAYAEPLELFDRLSRSMNEPEIRHFRALFSTTRAAKSEPEAG